MKMLASVVSGLSLWITTGGSTLFADPISVLSIPEATKWILHLDVDAGRNSVLEDLVRMRLTDPRKVQLELHPATGTASGGARMMDPLIDARLAIIQHVTGMRFPEECHDVTLYGGSYDEASVCVMIHGALKQATVVEFLKANGSFSSTPYNGHEVLRWRENDRGRMMYGAFSREDLAVISTDPKVLERALDVLDGKAPALKPTSALVPARPDPAVVGRTVLYVAADGLADLQRVAKADSPIVGLMDAAQLSIGVREQEVTAQFSLLARTEKSAQQMASVAEGVKAGLSLLADSDHAPARAKLAASAAQNLSFKAEGRTLKGEWSYGKENLDALVSAVIQEAGPPSNAMTPSTFPMAPATIKQH